MCRLCALATIVTLCVLQQAQAQIHDDFEDGNLLVAPEWFGDTWLFTTQDRGGSKWLRTNGENHADTLLILTPSRQSGGTWDVRYMYTGGRPTNFNHVRLILLRATLPTGVQGYSLQLGSNDGSIRLYEFADEIGNRRLLAVSEADILVADSLEVAIRVERDYRGTWRVFVNGSKRLEYDGPSPIENAGLFGIWLKHTMARGDSHWFDDLYVRSVVASDSIAPRLIRAIAADRFNVDIAFDEPVETNSICSPASFAFLPLRTPAADVLCPTVAFTDSVTVQSADELITGHMIVVKRLSDPSGNTRQADTLLINVANVQHLPRPGDLVINEIDYAPFPPESEFVEVFNRSGNAIDLSFVRIADDRTEVNVTDVRTLLPPGGFAVFARDSSALLSRFPGADVIELPGWPSLNNTGDLVAIISGTDTIDAVRYDPAWSASAGSLERVDPSLPSDYPDNWSSSIDALGGTPGKANSAFRRDVLPPELVSAAARPGGRIVSLRLSESIPFDTIRPDQIELRGLPPLRIVDPHVKYSSWLQLEFDTTSAGMVVIRNLTDAAGNVTTETRRRLHLQPYVGSVVINEILYEPIADEFDGRPDQPEFLEIRSLAEEPLTINDCVLFGPVNEHGNRDLLNFNSDAPPLEPHKTVVIVARDDRENLHRAFPDMPADAAVAETMESSLRLANDGSVVGIDCPDAREVERVAYRPEWHHDSLPSRGRSLERIDPLASALAPTNWSTSLAPSGATPGDLNSLTLPPVSQISTTGDIVVTEIMFEPRTSRPPEQFEYVELFNADSHPVDINGFSIRVTSSSNDTSYVRVAYGPTVVAAGQTALTANTVQDDTTQTVEFIRRAFPSFPDLTSIATILQRRKISLPNDGGTIELRDRDGEVVDRARYSIRFHHPHLAETRGTALERISVQTSGELASNWTSSVDPEGGTPGRPNSVQVQTERPVSGIDVSPSPFFPDRDGDQDHVVISYELRSTRPFVQATVFDSRGRVVRQLSRGMISSGSDTLIWNGLDDRGSLVRTGIYVVHIRATDVASGTTEQLRDVVVVATH